MPVNIEAMTIPGFGAALNAALRTLGCDILWQEDGAADAMPSLPELNLFLAPLGLQVTHATAPLEQVLETPASAVLVKTADGYAALAFSAGGRNAVLLGADGQPSDAPTAGIVDRYAGSAWLLQPLASRNMQGRHEPAYFFPLRAYWPQYAEILVAGVVVNFIALLTPVFSMLVYDRIVGNRISETLWALALGMVLAALLDFSLRAIRAWYIEHIAGNSDVLLDRALLRRLLHHDAAVLPPVGAVLNKYKELAAARDFITSGYLLSAADLPFYLLFMLALWIIGGAVALVPMVTGILMVATHAVCAIPARDYGIQSRKAAGSKVALLAEILSEGELLKTSFLRVPVARRWQSESEASAAAGARGRYWTALGSVSSNFWMLLTTVGTLVAGVYQIEARALTMGGLIACTMLASRSMMSLASVTVLFTRFREMRRSGKELDDLLGDSGEAPPAAQSVAPRPLEGRMTVRRLGYRFKADGPLALDGLTFNIEPGERVGLLGRPGSGKTTLLRCLAGVVRPSVGEVLVDGVAVRQHDAYSRARWMAYKPQEPILFEGTLEENILAGAEFADRAALARALEVAGLQEYIRRGELNLGMAIEPRGVNLSGGQRQAVALARSLVTAPSILLLDEPTAGLDVAGEKAIAARLREFSQGRTLVVATHSHIMLAMLDRLIVVDGGRIVADGPREKVLVA
ncbi:MAG TPA: ATP-binding cassette domain-containing protein [Gallionella sp.]|nr:ATP-binding cassette domain-containing protein [Gallionella sp.]